ncbi:DGQHR domain-containing protein [Marinobacter halodurans]|uniref:DGQHR domain-containing protein n=2 Tax=Marinobacter halodurans TaxID=2528979 RepID=A0ABY1ZII7_9GAMM|nr:DGQHR domain-containing protein [Marinobacter halodurans]
MIKCFLNRVDKMTYSVTFDAIKVSQPVGDFYCGVMKASDVTRISEADVRKIQHDDVGKYLGIQRELKPDRVKKISFYIKGIDATFPSSIILSINEENVSWDESSKSITLTSNEGEDDKIASILDGQHRLAGFNESNFEFENPDGSTSPFQLLVTIFVGADVSTQAGIFATVNLAQTKVNKSLVYDLQALAEARSPERTCHDIAVILNAEVKSPFYRSIKRLGVATPGVKGEFLTQATFVENVVKLISPDPKADRDHFLAESKFWRKNELSHLDRASLEKHFFRKAFIKDKDEVIASNLLNFFDAVRQKWPIAWSKGEKRSSLNKAIGFNALVRVFKDLYKIENSSFEWDKVISCERFLDHLSKCELDDQFFLELDPTSRSSKVIYDSIKKYYG